MPTNVDFKRTIESNLREFLSNDLKGSSLKLLNTLGYSSDKTIILEPNTAQGFTSFLKKNGAGKVNETKAHMDEWKSVDFLFQLTDTEIAANQSLFDSSMVDVSEKRIESYLFFAIELKNHEYRRSILAEITREINKVFPMPAMILFKHGETLTFSIIDRRLTRKTRHGTCS